MTPTPERESECVQIKRRAHERIMRETQGMTVEQEVSYWKAKEEQSRLRFEQVSTQRKAG